MGKEYEQVDYKIHIPNSKQLLLFSWPEVREFNQSAYKRTYFSEKYDLSKNGYVDWVTSRIQEIGSF